MIPHSWSPQDLWSLELLPSGTVAFLALISLSSSLIWVAITERLEKGGQGVSSGEVEGDGSWCLCLGDIGGAVT